ncbi:MAG: LCP family protein [Clostridia bacterium]|nr:LCP family protein [Clostridia bacterium]
MNSTKDKYKKNGYSKNKYLKKECQRNECKKNKYLVEEYQRNGYPKSKYLVKEYQRNKYKKNKYLAKKYQRNEYSKNRYVENEYQSKEYQQNKYHTKELQTNRYPKNQISKNTKIGKLNIKNKTKKIKQKIRKKILTIFLFIMVILMTLFIIRMNENGWTYGGFLATILGHNSKTAEKLETIYIVVTGESQNLTDSIMICAYNPKSNKASIMSIPRDTYTGSNQSKATASDKINTIYQKSPEELLKEVNEITGLNIKYYININTEGLRELIDSIGGVNFDVPINMDYDDPTQNLHIHLKAGNQLLDGEKAEHLLRFRHNNDGSSYPSSYGDNDIGRMKTQREFIKVLAQQISNKKSLNDIKQYIQIAKNNVTTNFNFDDIINYVPYIVDFNMQNLQTTTLPGESKKCNGVWLYIPNNSEITKTIKNMFESLNSNTNTNENNMPEITQQKNEQINIELLNGSSDQSKIKQVKKLLEQSGYNVTKTGVTNTVSKTSIINKADEAKGEADKIKQLLKVGTITSGKKSENIDFTIIIGKDY